MSTMQISGNAPWLASRPRSTVTASTPGSSRRSFVRDDEGHAARCACPNPLVREWLTKHYAGVLAEAFAEVGRPGVTFEFLTEEELEQAPAQAAGRDRRRRRPKPGRRSRRSSTPRGSIPRYTFDTLRRRAVEPVRPRGLPGRGRGAVALLQPALHLRRRGPRQDAHDARHRAVRADADAHDAAHLHLGRALHERDDQRAALRADPRVPRALPQRRPPARRRHPVHRRQGRHADRVLPHVQRALRLRRSRS